MSIEQVFDLDDLPVRSLTSLEITLAVTHSLPSLDAGLDSGIPAGMTGFLVLVGVVYTRLFREPSD